VELSILQELLNPLLRRAKLSFGAMFLGSSTETFTLELESEAHDDSAFSIAMYYDFYYKPLFRAAVSVDIQLV